MKTSYLKRIVILSLLLLSDVAISAEQIITPVPALEGVVTAEAVSVQVNYSSNNPSDKTLTGLGLRIHWDSSKLTFNNLTNQLVTALVATGAPEADSSDFDSDPTTDTFVQVAWTDINGAWPGLGEVFPVELFTANFTVVASIPEATTTTIKFSTSSTAAGFAFQSTSATKEISVVSTDVGFLSSMVATHNPTPVFVPLGDDNVMIVAPPSYNGKQPGVVRIVKPADNKFEVRFQEWRYLDFFHKGEEIPFLVLRKGRHIMSDGSIWEVGTFDLDGTAKWRSNNFSPAFPATPYLFLTAQTSNGGQPVSVRAKEVTAAGFMAALFEEQQLMDGHKLEKIAYLAIYSTTSSGTINLGGEALTYNLRRPQVSHEWQTVLGHSLLVEEEQSADEEIRHKFEQLDVLGLGPYLFAQDVSSLGGDPAALRQKPVE